MHSVTVSYHDLASKERVQRSSTKEKRSPIETYRLMPHGLYFQVCMAKGEWHTMQAHVLPALHLQVVKVFWRERPSYDYGDGYDYYLDIVRVAETGERWVVRDLYLDLVVFEGHKVEVLDTDEYLEALHEGHFEPGEAEHALTVTHETLNGLAECGYSLESYLAAKGITLTWS
jgi:predicted RNA-binding protein associated with RNAse of E/G family